MNIFFKVEQQLVLLENDVTDVLQLIMVHAGPSNICVRHHRYVELNHPSMERFLKCWSFYFYTHNFNDGIILLNLLF